MLMRSITVAGLALSNIASADASPRHGVTHRISCSEVRYYVAKYSAATAEMYARSQGATDSQINAARRCLDGEPVQTAQRGRRYTE